MIPIYAQRIREVRQKAGLTQTEFAQAIGTTKNQLSKYELGAQDTPTKIIIAVCENYKVDANWLLGLDIAQKYSELLNKISKIEYQNLAKEWLKEKENPHKEEQNIKIG